MSLLPVLRKDGYKADHRSQYLKGTSLIYSNMTPRSSRTGFNQVVGFGYQYYTTEYLIRKWNRDFFEQPVDDVLRRYKRRIDHYLGKGAITYDHIADLHKLGYLPVRIKAVPEGTLVPLRVPFLTIRNTKDEFFWLTNMLETNMSNILWGPATSATTAFQYRLNFERFARKTGFPQEMIKWMAHDFSYRGMFGEEAALMSGAAHLLSFTGTDTIPAIDFLEEYYGADCEKELIGMSVPATEHSVMSLGGATREEQTTFIRRLITEVYPTGIVSIVCDTWNYWDVIEFILPALRDEILARDGKVVIRPDSGDPVKIICGDFEADREVAREGTMRALYRIFGGKANNAGYIEIDPHIGAIYGDSITIQRQVEILGRLGALGFASIPVLGVGSFTYQYVTRDTYGIAMKATFAKVNGEERNIFKKPATDDGTKNSAKGLLRVEDCRDVPANPNLVLIQGVSWEEEAGGVLQDVFIDSKQYNLQYLGGIRGVIDEQIRQAA